MNFIGNLKSNQLRMLFEILKSSLVQSLRIFWVIECFCFEFTSLRWFEYWKNLQTGRGPLVSALQTVSKPPFQPRPPRLAIAHRFSPTTIFPATISTCVRAQQVKASPISLPRHRLLPATTYSAPLCRCCLPCRHWPPQGCPSLPASTKSIALTSSSSITWFELELPAATLGMSVSPATNVLRPPLAQPSKPWALPSFSATL
jgi:hypothetical protein